MESSEVEINMAIELDMPIQDRTKSDIDNKVKKDPCLRDLLTPINQVELNIEAKAEIIELVNVPIQNGIKSVSEVELNKDLKDKFDVKSIIDEVIQNVIEVTDQLDHGNVQHLASGKRPKFKNDTENEKNVLLLCSM